MSAASHLRLELATNVFTCFFEPATGFVRRVQHGNVEVIRAIYAAVRDYNWDTILPRIEVTALRRDDRGFELRFTARCRQRDVGFDWESTLRGEGGELSFTFRGEATSAFRRNRIGFCILHPIRECAGRRVRYQTSGGAWHEGTFPQTISPHQPFLDLQRFAWQPAPGMEAELTFEGDTFEMEDQRNWTDASFKTYCPPLALPFPVPVEPGQKVAQRVHLQVAAPSVPLIGALPREEIRLDPHIAPQPFPSVGFQLGPKGLQSAWAIERLAALRPGHLRVDLPLHVPGWADTLHRALDVAHQVDTRIHCALHLSDAAESELAALQPHLDPARVALCFVFHAREKSTSVQWAQLTRRLLPGIPLAIGTDSYFTELNRERPPGNLDVVYSFNPQVHAFDDLSLMETLEAQPETLRNAATFTTGRIHVGPVTLRPRFNPNATEADGGAGASDGLPFSVDPRQREPIAAAWTVGTLASLLGHERMASFTCFEVTGWKGLFAEEAIADPDFPALTREIFPVYHVFAALGKATRWRQARWTPRAAWIHYETTEGRDGLLVANLEGDTQPVALLEANGPFRAATLHEGTLAAFRAQDNPLPTAPAPSPDFLELPPYAVMFGEAGV